MKKIFSLSAMSSLVAIGLSSFCGAVFAEEPDPKSHLGPCKEIKVACEKAGFYKGGAKEGKGLWINCIDALVNGKETSHTKATLPLPQVDSALIAQCKEKHMMSGEKHGGKHHHHAEGRPGPEKAAESSPKNADKEQD